VPQRSARRFALAAAAAGGAVVVLAPAAPAMGGPAAARRPAPVAYVANLVSGTVSRIRLGAARAEPPVRLGRRSGPFDIAAAPGGRTIWVADIGNGTVTPVSTRTGRAGRPVHVPAQPDELAVAPDGKTVWVASQIDGNNQTPGRVTPISTATGRAGQPIRVGIDPGPLVISPDSRTVYLATAGLDNQTLAGNLTVISARTDRVRRVLTGFDPDDMALGRGGRMLYIADEQGADEQGTVIPIRTATLRPGRPIRLAGFLQQLILGPGGRALYVLNDSGRLSRISLPADRVTWSARTAPLPTTMGLAPDGRSLYVLGLRRNQRPGYVVPVSTSSGAAGHRIAVGRAPIAIAFGPGGRTAYVLCSPYRLTGDRLKFGIGSVFPVILATGRSGQPVPTGRGAAPCPSPSCPARATSPPGRAGSPLAGQRRAVNQRNSTRATWTRQGFAHTPTPPGSARNYGGPARSQLPAADLRVTNPAGR
jgi:DNA-binding beta-propeller fold protein YncE